MSVENNNFSSVNEKVRDLWVAPDFMLNKLWAKIEENTNEENFLRNYEAKLTAQFQAEKIFFVDKMWFEEEITNCSLEKSAAYWDCIWNFLANYNFQQTA